MPHIILLSLLSKSEKKKAQKKDRVYEHLQHQIAGQRAARRGDKEKDKETFELFVDRQRQAAVVLGVRDIAGDVQAKRRREKSRRFFSSLNIKHSCV